MAPNRVMFTSNYRKKKRRIVPYVLILMSNPPNEIDGFTTLLLRLCRVVLFSCVLCFKHKSRFKTAACGFLL